MHSSLSVSRTPFRPKFSLASYQSPPLFFNRVSGPLYAEERLPLDLFLSFAHSGHLFSHTFNHSFSFELSVRSFLLTPSLFSYPRQWCVELH
jgi:hypothetical protein